MLVVSFHIKRSCLLHAARAWWRETAKIWQCRLFDPYRPEFHYMRGPGPKWREKHGNIPTRPLNAPRKSNG